MTSSTLSYTIPFDAALTEIEQLLAETSASLLSGDAPALENQARVLRECLLSFATAAESQKAAMLGSAALRQRMADVSRSLANQRDALARRSFVVDRCLSTLLPRPEAATYSGQAAPVYGGGGARIYASRAN